MCFFTRVVSLKIMSYPLLFEIFHAMNNKTFALLKCKEREIFLRHLKHEVITTLSIKQTLLMQKRIKKH